MCKCLVGLCHLVRIFLLLDGCARVVGGIHQLTGKALIHGLLATQTSIVHDPADTESHAAVRTNLDRHLVVGTADAARAYLENRHNILESRLEAFQRILARLGTDRLERIINDSLGNALTN